MARSAELGGVGRPSFPEKTASRELTGYMLEWDEWLGSAAAASGSRLDGDSAQQTVLHQLVEQVTEVRT